MRWPSKHGQTAKPIQLSLPHQGTRLRSAPPAARLASVCGFAPVSAPLAAPSAAARPRDDRGDEWGSSRRPWAGRLHGFTHLPGPGPCVEQAQGPNRALQRAGQGCPICEQAYEPLAMLDPNPGRTPAKPATPTSGMGLRGRVFRTLARQRRLCSTSTVWRNMRPQESYISVSLVEDLSFYPQEVWGICLCDLDLFTEEIVAELDKISWADGNEYPRSRTFSARYGVHEWGASGSFANIAMQLATDAAGGASAVAVVAAIGAVFRKLKSRSQGEMWRTVPTTEEAIRLAKARIKEHYDIAVDNLEVIASEIDAEANRYDLTFAHSDGRKFGATVGAVSGLATCVRVWSDGATRVPRPLPEPGLGA